MWCETVLISFKYRVTLKLTLLTLLLTLNHCIVFSKKLDRTTAELKVTALALEEEKKKTDTLLYQMLPMKVANQLRDGIKVDAGEGNMNVCTCSEAALQRTVPYTYICKLPVTPLAVVSC